MCLEGNYHEHFSRITKQSIVNLSLIVKDWFNIFNVNRAASQSQALIILKMFLNSFIILDKFHDNYLPHIFKLASRR